MTEVHDLQPDKPAGEALTPGQVALYVKAKSAERPCEACGHDGFEMCPELDAVFAKQRGTVLLACRQCNTLRTILRPPVVAWLRGSRRG